MKLNYKQKIFFHFSLLLTLFAASIFLFEYSEAKRYKTEALEERLDAYANTIFRSIQKDSLLTRASQLSILNYLPHNLRVTILDLQGNIIFDNSLPKEFEVDNHLKRKEIKLASLKGKGSDVRMSKTTEEKSLYYARQFNTFYIRVALPYNIQIKETLKIDNISLYFILILFIIGLYSIYILSHRLSISIKQLRNFILNPKDWDRTFLALFPDDELGEVASKVVETYKKLEISKSQVAQEREKLMQHIHSSEEGICFFTSGHRVEFYNGLFMYYLNIMLDAKSNEPAEILSDPLFKEIQIFVQQKDASFHELVVQKQGKLFSIRANIFEDRSFEIIINDNTKQEKTRLLKQEMTSNIAHELRTPITSIRGYLETIRSQDLSVEQSKYFTNKAFDQVINLSNLIEDMSLITKIEEAPESIVWQTVNMKAVINKVYLDFSKALEQEEMHLESNVDEKCTIKGNQNLIYTIFKNLIENAIKYAGKKTTIQINCYNEDESFYYFSFSDDGIGIKEEYLNRLFERFYRISEGRTRKTGGTGLGLSIVKNSIMAHKGNIIVKNRPQGGLEYLFKLKKN